MPKLTLAERLERSARRRIKAEQEDAQLREIQRKQRSRQLIELGGLLAKAGIDTLPTSALYSCFLRIAEEARSDPDKVALWESEGRRHLEPEQTPRIVAVARFTGKLSPEVTAALRRLGFRWNSILVQWEGRVVLDEAEPVVTQAGGTLTSAKPHNGQAEAS